MAGIVLAVLAIAVCQVGGEMASSLEDLSGRCGGDEDFQGLGICGAVNKGTRGIFTSPNYPGDYELELRCGQTFEVSQGHVCLTFLTFDLEHPHSGHCAYDRLEIYDGGIVGPTRLKTELCGDAVPGPVGASGRQIHLYLTTDDNKVAAGFCGTWHAISDPNVCCGNPCKPGNCTRRPNGDPNCDCAGTGYHGTVNCSIDNCHNNGPCVRGLCYKHRSTGEARCDCHGTGYHGEHCSVDNCVTLNPCIHGECVNHGNGTLSCDCSQTGYNDGNCSTDNCVSHNPCIHGECINNGDDTLSCDCSGTGYNGDNCSTDNCVSHNPCVHGVCINNGDGTMSCDCRGTGYGGENCSYNCSVFCGIHPASEQHGRCVCACLDGYTNGDAQTCVDVDECVTQDGVCGMEKCVNTPGSFKCVDDTIAYWRTMKYVGGTLAVIAMFVATVGVAMIFRNAINKPYQYGQPDGVLPSPVIFSGTLSPSLGEFGSEDDIFRDSTSSMIGHAGSNTSKQTY